MNITKLVVVIFFIICICIAYSLHIPDYLTLEQINIHKNYLATTVTSHYLLSIVIYMILYCLLVALALPAAGILSLAGGAYLGILCATICVCFAATVGATISFFMARYVLRDIIEDRYSNWISRLNNELEKHGYNYMLVLRLFPVTPFFIINPIAGLTRLPAITFIWTTFTGIVPGTIVFTAAGKRIASIQSINDVLTWQTIIVLVGLTILAIVPIAVQRIKNMKLNKGTYYEI